MGWQPGSSYYVFHTGYSDPLAIAYPEVAEANLALGQPRPPATGERRPALAQLRQRLRRDEHRRARATVHVPYAASAFDDGIPQDELAAGQTVRLGAHDTLYLLSNKYLNGH